MFFNLFSALANALTSHLLFLSFIHYCSPLSVYIAASQKGLLVVVHLLFSRYIDIPQEKKIFGKVTDLVQILTQVEIRKKKI